MSKMTDAFWARVDKNGPVHPVLGTPCWLWVGYRKIYGELCYTDDAGRVKHQAAHRVSWIMANGRRVGNGKVICHRCDNPPCVNPDHLFEGTPSENMRDMFAKRRQRSPFGRVGEASLQAKITDAQATQIRIAALDPTVRFERLGEIYGLCAASIYECVIGKTYGHLPVLETPRRKHKNSPMGAGVLTCSRCKTTKPHGDFYPSMVASGSGWCRTCHAGYSRDKRLESQAPCPPPEPLPPSPA